MNLYDSVGIMIRFVSLALLALVGLPTAVAQDLGSSPLDYGDSENWLCRPDRPRYCDIDLSTTVISPDGEMSIERYRPAANPEGDCFYVYPTTSRDPTPLSDTMPGDSEEIAFVRHQFARFGAVCRLFAPLYRQHTIASVFGDAGPGDEDVVRADLEAAWRSYLARDNGGRGVILIGHSQGARLLRELIRDRIDGESVQARIVSAMLIGTDVVVGRGMDVGGDFDSMPLCRAPGQVGCVIVYASFRSTVPPGPGANFGTMESYLASRRQLNNGDGEFENDADISELNARLEIGCTNPAALGGDSGPLDAYLPKDMYEPPFDSQLNTPQQLPWVRGNPPISTPFVRVPGLLSSKCVSNSNGTYLEVTVHGNPESPRVGDILGDIYNASGQPMSNFGLHLVDIHLAMGNLIEVARRQLESYRSTAR